MKKYFITLLLIVCSLRADAQELQGGWDDPAIVQDVYSDSFMSVSWSAYRSAVIRGRYDSVVNALIGISWAYHLQGSYDSSIRLLRIAWGYNSMVRSNPARIKMYHILANYYLVRNQYERAVYYNYKAIEEIDRHHIRDFRLVSRVYSLAAYSLVLTKQYKEAVSYLTKSIALASRHGDSALLGLYYNNLGHLFGSKGEVHEAIKYFREAYDIATEAGTWRTRLMSSINLATMYARTGELDKAVDYGKKSLEIGKGYRSPRETINASYSLGSLYLMKGDYRKAINYLLPASEEALSIGLNDKLGNAYLKLSYAYRMLGNSREAFRYIDAYFEGQDSVDSERFAKLAYEMEAKYAGTRKDKEIVKKKIEILQQQNEIRHKNIWLWSSVCTGALVLLLIYMLYRNTLQKQRLATAQLDTYRQRQELDQLHAVIEGEEKERSRLAKELHDGLMVQFAAIKMDLSMLPGRHPSLEQAPDFSRILHLFDDATTELRKTAHHLMPEMLLRDGLVNALIYFCHNLQESSGIRIDFQTCEPLPRLPHDFELLIYRIIQELLHNVIKYSGASNAIVQIGLNGNTVNLTVEDDGNGFPLTFHEGKGNGMGIAGIRSRVAALNGTMEVSGLPGEGVSVYIEMDVPQVNTAIQ